jgi:hypothetical protein
MTEFLIRADNPKGLDYEYLHDTVEAAKSTVKRIAFQGGVNITLNGQPIPMELIAALNVS